MKVDPARYRSETHDYECEVCGWTGFPDCEGGVCLNDRIPCPECGIDVLIDEPQLSAGQIAHQQHLQRLERKRAMQDYS